MGSEYRSGDMAYPSVSDTSLPHTRQSESDNVVKVHTSPVRPPHVSSLHSIFPEARKLYRYDRRQIEVCVHRQSGIVESLPAHGGPYEPQNFVENTDVATHTKLMYEDEKPKQKVHIVGNEVEISRNIGISCNPDETNSSVGKYEKGSWERVPTPVLQDVQRALEKNPHAQYTQEVAEPASCACEAMAVAIVARERELDRLKMLLDLKEDYLVAVQKEKGTLIKQNVQLMKKLAETNAVSQLCQVADNLPSIKNQDKIMELIERATTASTAKDDLKRMGENLKKLREHVDELSGVKSKKSPATSESSTPPDSPTLPQKSTTEPASKKFFIRPESKMVQSDLMRFVELHENEIDFPPSRWDFGSPRTSTSFAYNEEGNASPKSALPVKSSAKAESSAGSVKTDELLSPKTKQQERDAVKPLIY